MKRGVVSKRLRRAYRALRIRLPALFRFRRVLGYRDRNRPDPRRPRPGKFQRALPETEYRPLLEQLAHDAHRLDPQLLLQSADTRAPQAKTSAELDHRDRPDADDDADRTLAWRDGQLPDLGPLERAVL